MRSKLLAVLLVGILTCVVSGQTANDLRKKYEAQEFFEIRPKILMKGEYNAVGEVCSVFFQPNHYSVKEKTVFVGNSSIELHDLLSIFDELAPIQTRNGKGSSLGYIGQGGIVFGGFTFENIRFNVKRDMWQKEKSNAHRVLTVEKGSENEELVEFLNSFGTPETASISWTKRRGCGD